MNKKVKYYQYRVTDFEDVLIIFPDDKELLTYYKYPDKPDEWRKTGTLVNRKNSLFSVKLKVDQKEHELFQSTDEVTRKMGLAIIKKRNGIASST